MFLVRDRGDVGAKQAAREAWRLGLRWRVCDDGASETTPILTASSLAFAQLHVACVLGDGEGVKLLLADERVDVNQANKVRVAGWRGWRERAGRAERCGTECRACHGGGRQKLTSAVWRV